MAGASALFSPFNVSLDILPLIQKAEGEKAMFALSTRQRYQGKQRWPVSALLSLKRTQVSEMSRFSV